MVSHFVFDIIASCYVTLKSWAYTRDAMASQFMFFIFFSEKFL